MNEIVGSHVRAPAASARHAIGVVVALASGALWYFGRGTHQLERLWERDAQSFRQAALSVGSWLLLLLGVLVALMFFAGSKKAGEAVAMWILTLWVYLWSLGGAFHGGLRGLILVASLPLGVLAWLLSRRAGETEGESP
jgi:hypothetical protein